MTLLDKLSDLGRSRTACTTFFALGGFLFAGWAVRIPAVKEQTGATSGALGLALFAMTASAVGTMAVAGRLCRRFGSARVTVAAGGLLSVSVVPPAMSDSVPMLATALVVFGVAYGAIDVAVNSVAVELVAALERPIMPGLHAANSLGSLAGAGLGALVAAHLSPTTHMLLLAPVGLVTTVVAGRMLLARSLPAPDRAGGGRLSTVVVLFGLVGLCAAYGQGALDNWVPLHITEDLGGGPGVAAAGYAVVQGTMTVGRLGGARLLELLGQRKVVLYGGAIAVAGAIAAALASSTVLVFAGLALTGIGLANIFPVAMARAGALGGPNGVALASTLGYGGILLAPPTIGLLADQTGLPVALCLVPAMIAAATAISTAARSDQ